MASPFRKPSPAKSLPSPEAIFFAWLMGVPDDVDARQAAAEELARLERHNPRTAEGRRLVALFREAATSSTGQHHVHHNREIHP